MNTVKTMKPGRLIAVGALGLFWCIAIFGLGVFITRNTNGENVGKFVGTLVSGVAFVPPVVVFLRWYRATEGDSIRNRPRLTDQTTDPQPSPSGADHP
jgi:hypothetical protein